MIIDEINKENVMAMKNHDATARAIYGVVKNKIMLNQIDLKAQGKEQTDAEVVSIIQKTIKELNDEKENYIKVNNVEEANIIEQQKELLVKFLPKMMSETEIKNEIAKLSDKSIPSVMKHFKANFAGKVDMGLVSKIAREM